MKTLCRVSLILPEQKINKPQNLLPSAQYVYAAAQQHRLNTPAVNKKRSDYTSKSSQEPAEPFKSDISYLEAKIQAL